MQTYWENAVVATLWDAEIRAVRMEWRAFVEGETFRTALLKGLELAKREGAENWLADMKLMGPITFDDQRWADEVWLPKALEAGVRRVALVMPEKPPAELAVLKITDAYGRTPIKRRRFDDLEEARAWLRENE
jgi:hypothetical protein